MTNTTKNGLLVGVAVACGLGLSAEPWMLARKERATAAQRVREAEADEARMVQNRAEEAHLGTELGKEERLRDQGYLKTGEAPLNR